MEQDYLSVLFCVLWDGLHVPDLCVASALTKAADNAVWWFVQAEQLEKDGFQSVEDLEQYAENTASSLYYLLLECLGESGSP